jgi:hypothetical protein
MAKVTEEMFLADARACFTISLRDDRELRAEINNVRTGVIGTSADSAADFSASNCTSRDMPAAIWWRRWFAWGFA